MGITAWFFLICNIFVLKHCAMCNMLVREMKVDLRDSAHVLTKKKGVEITHSL